MTSLKELLAQRADIEKRITDAQREERSAAVAKIKSLMAEHGLSTGDISGRAASSRPAATKPPGKVAAKYRNAATGDTWSGRGLRPKWLRGAISSGAKIEDFAV